MDNQIENQVKVQPQNKKSGKGLIVLVVILVLLVLGLGGYIVYDKFIATENGKTEEPTQTETQVDDNTSQGSTDEVLTNDIALGFGKYLYDYATNNIFNICSVGDINGMVYNNGNIKDVDCNYSYKEGDYSAAIIFPAKIGLLTSTALENFKKQKGIQLIKDNYYIVGDYGDCYQGRMENFSKISIKSISNDKIDYDIVEYYCKDIDNYKKCEEKDNNYLNEIKTIFTISKINGQWKISHYEDSHQKNYELNNN